MADVKLNTLPQSTSPTSTQDLLLFDESTNAGQRINYNTLADVILAKLTSKTYTVGGGTQTLISAIDALNSNLLSKTGAASYLSSGTLAENIKTICPGKCDVTFQCNNAWGQTDLPASSGLVFVRVTRSTGSGIVHLEAYVVGGDADVYHSQIQYNDLSVNPIVWIKSPSRAELFTESTATRNSNFGTVYSSSVWKIGSLAFYFFCADVANDIGNNEIVLTLPYISMYRHDSTFLNIDGTPICDAYISANSQTLKTNGAILPAGRTVKVSGFYQIK